jgi:hypothetical protein
MFVSGFIAERVNLRYFLSLGMLMSGIFSYLFGIAKSYNIHNLSYYIVVQVSTDRQILSTSSNHGSRGSPELPKPPAGLESSR